MKPYGPGIFFVGIRYKFTLKIDFKALSDHLFTFQRALITAFGEFVHFILTVHSVGLKFSTISLFFCNSCRTYNYYTTIPDISNLSFLFYFVINLTRGLSILLIFKKKKTLQLFNFTDFSPCSSTFYFIDLCPAVYYFLSPADSGCNLLFFFYFFKMEADKHRFEVLLAFKQVSAVTFPPSVA